MIHRTRILVVVAALSLGASLTPGCPGGTAGEGEGEGAAGEGEGEGGEGEGAEGEGEGEGDSREALPQNLIDAVHAATLTCIESVGPGLIDELDPNGGQTFGDAIATQFLGELQIAVNDEFVTIDDAAVTACIADLASPVCTNGFPAELGADSCGRLLRGTLHAGDSCQDQRQCASQNCDTTTCTCVGDTPPATVDVDAFPCFTEFDCGLGQGCDVVQGPSGPQSASCVPSCGQDSDCQAGEHCANGACVAGLAASDFCTLDSECGVGLHCFRNQCERTLAAGEACPDFSCGVDTLFCDDTGHCAATLPAGSPCTFDECDAALSCINQICAQGPTIGSPCNNEGGAQCFTGFCDNNTNFCTQKGSDGGSCFDASQCLSGICDASRSVCVAAEGAADGADCSDAACGGGLLCATEAAGSVCRARLTGRALHDPCTAGTPGLCPIGMTCTTAGTCELVTVVDTGACSSSIDPGPSCSNGLSTRFCQVLQGQSSGTCADRPSAGQACPDGICTSDAFCNSGVCVLLGAAGADCTSAPCDPTLVCDNGLCHALADVASGIPDDQCVP